MQPTSQEIEVYFYPNKIAHFIMGICFAFLLAFLFHHTWIVPTILHHGFYRGPFYFYLVKFLAIPVLAILCVYCFKMLFSKAKVVELRVGENGIWRRPLFGKETFIPWTEIKSVNISKSTKEKLLVFNVKDLKKYPVLMLGHNGVYITERSCPVPLEDFVQRCCRFAAFKERYRLQSPNLN